MREGHVDLVEGGLQLVEVEVLELQGARQHDVPLVQAVAGVNQCQFMRLVRNRRRDAGIHTTAQQDDRLGSPTHCPLKSSSSLLDAILNRRVYTPRVAGCHMNL